MKTTLSLSKEKIKITLLEGIHPSAVATFENNDYHKIERFTHSPEPDEWVERHKDTHILGIRSRTQISTKILQQLPKLIAIGCFCIGIDQVDLEDAARKGIPVFNAPHSNTRSVAELVIGLTIMLLREIFPKSFAAHNHEWQKSMKQSSEVRGKTMGIIGYGHIGSQVSVLAESMGMQVFYYDIQIKLPLGNAKQVDSIDQLLSTSDIVTIHVSENDTSRNLMNRDRIKKMKRSACLINASRGSIVDLDSLAESLKKKQLQGAAIDVFPKEPGSQTEKFESPLIGLHNVILTPHIGGSTMEAQKNIGIEVANKLVLFSDRGATEGAVNFPGVKLPPNENAHRILHIHENKPGILKEINEKVAEKGINIHAQYLETNNSIGYVVLDIDPMVSKRHLKLLRQEITEIDGTIRTRMLY